MTDVNADLLAALKEASDHLEYCGYGDSWERECADDSGLPEKIADAIEAAERGESANAEREQARSEHLGELAAEREMVQAQTPVVNVEAAIRLGEEAE